ncbi:8-oxo-dGTP diphosphatase [Balneicella halophila]|uniref:8-oxo-dGTP diphosphatase n=1 Tax=Balneicella halophila TaxID=1537566 RepID=A0A7L4USL7_BALHA|nr:NUDIX hydrolase [Balneicella halophila]PVX52227.1 8-oxo-dGTP diphosphatase [Balneicella halophila]
MTTFCYKYPRPAVTVDAVVFSLLPIPHTQVLLVQRKNSPFENQWALPGGFLDMNETVEEAVKRELQEETGLLVKNLKHFKVFSSLDRDPRARTISVAFVSTLTMEPLPLVAGDDAEDAQWFPIDKLPELAFDHKQIIEEAIKMYIDY